MNGSETRGQLSGRGRKLGALVTAFAVAIALPWIVLAMTGRLDSGAGTATTPPGVAAASPRVAPVPTVSGSSLEGRLESAGIPIRVTVPALGVRSLVVPISGNTGILLPPSDPRRLGWWQEGRAVGAAAGATVITGHTVHSGGGALDALSTLRVRDQVVVTTTAGRITYEVRKVEDVPPATLARRAPRLFSAGGSPRLVLITCSDWDGTKYLANTVVRAVPVEDRPA